VPIIAARFEPFGPVVTAVFGVSLPRYNALTKASMAVPALQTADALLDTGASGTCVDPEIITTLGLTPTGTVPVRTPSTGQGSHPAEQYDVRVIIPGPAGEAPLIIQALPILCMDLKVQGFRAIIGRDILAKCQLTYWGVARFVALAY
jgi:hypothetical protein